MLTTLYTYIQAYHPIYSRRKFLGRDVLVVATDEFKIKVPKHLVHYAATHCHTTLLLKVLKSSQSRQCIKTVISPTYGGPLNRLFPIQGPTAHDRGADPVFQDSYLV